MAAAAVTVTSASDLSNLLDQDSYSYYYHLRDEEKTLIIDVSNPNPDFNGDIAAGFAGDDEDIPTLSGYTITITEKGGNFGIDLIGAYNYSGSAATNNQVIFNNGTSYAKIIGGWASYNTENNTVTISGGKVTDVYGGRSGQIATGNKVYITGGEVLSDGHIYGGYNLIITA